MENNIFYSLPMFWKITVFENFFILEIIVLILAGLLLYFFFKNEKLKTLLFIIFWVFLYKILTLSIFWNGTTSTCWWTFFPSLSIINIFTWILSVIEIWFSILIVQKIFSKKIQEKSRNLVFSLQVFFAFIFAIIDEFIIRWLNLRVYNIELENLIWWIKILGIPLESYFYILIWIILILWVYSYTKSLFWKKTIKKTSSFFKYFLYSFMAMFFIEILIHPILDNKWLPDFTYIYQDINIALTISWALSFSIIIYLIDLILKKYKFKISKYEYVSLNLFILFLFNLLIFSLLFKYNIVSLSTMANDYIWWINLFWIPIEIFSGLFIINIMTYAFVKSRLIK